VLRRIERDTHEDYSHVADLRRRARVLAGDLDNIVLKALSKRPEQRYPSVEALALDLRRYEEGRPVLARSQGVGYRVRKYFARHRWTLLTATTVVVVLGLSIGLVAWQARQALAEAARAQAMQDFMVGLFEQAGGAPGQAVDLRSLLATAEARDRAEPQRQPRARAELLGLLARLRLGLGDYREAQTLLRRQAAIVDNTRDIPDSLKLESLTLRGQMLALQDQAAECIALMQPFLDLARNEQAQLPPQSSQFYSQLGRCRRAAGERQGARQMYERSLAVRRETPSDDVGIVENLIDLAALQPDHHVVEPAGVRAGAEPVERGAGVLLGDLGDGLGGHVVEPGLAGLVGGHHPVAPARRQLADDQRHLVRVAGHHDHLGADLLGRVGDRGGHVTGVAFPGLLDRVQIAQVGPAAGVHLGDRESLAALDRTPPGRSPGVHRLDLAAAVAGDHPDVRDLLATLRDQRHRVR